MFGCSTPSASRVPSHPSSMLTNWKPCAARPLDTIASAAARTLASSTDAPQTFHEFQPSGGVNASASSPPMIVSVRVARPLLLVAVIETSLRPALAICPLMIPDFSSSVSPAGRPRAENVSGASPVAGTRNKNGRPGVPPVMRGGLMRGVAGQADAIGGAGSDGNVHATRTAGARPRASVGS